MKMRTSEADRRYSKTEKFKKCQQRYRLSEKGKAKDKKYCQSEKRKKAYNKYNRSDRGKEAHRSQRALRRARELQASPIWADGGTINGFYASCPPGYHVDHIVPLRGKNVSGLHVLWNLQYLPATENRIKGNKFD